MEKVKEKKERNTAIDIIRIIALLAVISTHFFLNSEFYITKNSGKTMLIATIIRSATRVCVPLFIMLTGYLMSKKELNKKYYSGIKKTLYIYLIACVCCIIYKYTQGVYTRKIQMLLAIPGFYACGYSWYIEMYIGLFLLIPFLNLIYNNLKSKKDKKILIITLMFLTSIPLITNCFNFMEKGWWQRPIISKRYDQILPAFWISIYPIMYYYMGCYIREFKPKSNKILDICLFGLIAILFGAFCYYRNYGGKFNWDMYQEWASLPIVIMTWLVFNFFINIDFNKLPNILRSILACVADFGLGAYLVSEIFDKIFYKILNSKIPEFVDRLPYMILMVPLVFVCSILISAIINLSYKLIEKIFGNFKEKRITEGEKV